MTANGWFQVGVFFFVLLAITKPLGVYMARVFSKEKTFMDPLMRPIELLIYRLPAWTKHTKCAGRSTPYRCFS